MPAHKLMKTVFGKANRSGFHNLVAPVRRQHYAPEAGLDAFGSGIIVGLSIAILLFMRLILTN